LVAKGTHPQNAVTAHYGHEAKDVAVVVHGDETTDPCLGTIDSLAADLKTGVRSDNARCVPLYEPAQAVDQRANSTREHVVRQGSERSLGVPASLPD
jgi:hypothetical protein